MYTKIFASILLGLVSISSFAQDDSSKSLKVVNDPLLWRSALKLRPAQENRILLLNEAFYNALLSNGGGEPQVKSKTDLSKLIEERSEQIWSTFSTRQKKTWRKLSASYNGSSTQAISL